MSRFVFYGIIIQLALTGVMLANDGNGQSASLNEIYLTLIEEDAQLADVFNKIETTTSFKFSYYKSIIEDKDRITINAQQQSLGDILSEIARKSGLRFKRINGNIYVDLDDKDKYPTVDELIIEDNQQLVITGKVTDGADGQSLPGVNVLLKGTKLGTTTDIYGSYSLSIPAENVNGTLIFSFIGYKAKEYAIGNQTVIDVVMESEAQTLNEIVVTALGIEKSKSALAYSVTEVKGEEFTQAREINVANALTGKIAGVNATGLSTGPGGSSRVIIRGNGSLNGNNQPLYVVNGMPIDNSNPGGSPSANGGGLNIDRGDGISGINPDDIESISVLKGGTAAALYGARAANGVILITTKKGAARQGIGVEYNSTFTFETPAIFPQKFQYEYGHGKLGRKPTTQTEAISWGRHSWGAKIDGQDYMSLDGEMHPYSAVNVKDNIKEFYRTGTTFTNTIALTGGSEDLNYRLSVSNMDNEGILPNSSLNKKIANLSLSGQLGERITIEASAQYNLEEVHNRTMAGDANGNPNWILMLANTVNATQLSPGYLENGDEFVWNETPYATNPYFIINRYQTKDEKNRFIGMTSVKYDILDDLYVKGTVSRDFYNFNFVGIIPTGTQYLAIPGSGEYHGLKSVVSETNAMANLNYHKSFNNVFDATLMVGANKRIFTQDETSIDGTQFILPYFYSYTNLTSITNTPNYQKTETNSVFGSLDLDYKGIAYLSLTGRQDWFSTLSLDNNTIFYPSIGGSLVLSEAFDLPGAISYAKLRGSWAQVGGAIPDPYAVNLTYSMVQGGHAGQAIQNVTSSTITDPNLRPLTSTTYELGLEGKLFNGALGFDIAYYNRKTSDDIVNTAIPITSGYSYAQLNVGELQNKGIEVLLTATPVNAKGFIWDVSYNFAYNQSEITKLAEGLNTIQMSSSVGGWAGVYNDIGRPYGIIKGYDMLRNDNGDIVFNSTSGYPVRSELVELGQGVPPLTMGLTNTFNYKRLSLSVLLDGKFGNKVFSVMNTYAMRFGLLENTLEGRENGLDLEGVDEEGNPYTSHIDYDSDAFRLYYDNQKNYSVLNTFDGSFVKLRQVILGYNIPKEFLKAAKIQSASLSFVARNLAILYRKTENFDPETSHTNGNAQGFESFALPRTRSFGFNLKVKF
ncbi:SusC/RagA family TonB-linked outer membrane protein [Chondrinema litorale]|uniref:SusC/RagA family TonB-linked outer membrane protein n=1 Tax=Chondrinema litorale TaxID=2994555 RepID=UPI002542FC61|nr:SusC/RagA family TonB-linked outer membrane protein [Chondrinema litorale]UZR96633.1 SusC/RagA family TonB-linked outer membrane protein [Chondrinema litorale]